jgi:hypothetical protein
VAAGEVRVAVFIENAPVGWGWRTVAMAAFHHRSTPATRCHTRPLATPWNALHRSA